MTRNFGLTVVLLLFFERSNSFAWVDIMWKLKYIKIFFILKMFPWKKENFLYWTTYIYKMFCWKCFVKNCLEEYSQMISNAYNILWAKIRKKGIYRKPKIKVYRVTSKLIRKKPHWFQNLISSNSNNLLHYFFPFLTQHYVSSEKKKCKSFNKHKPVHCELYNVQIVMNRVSNIRF